MAQRGQASVEYVAVVALVAAVLTVAGLAVGVAGVREAVVGGIRHALCVVTGAACDADLPPCTVASTEVRERGEASLLLVRAGRDHAVVRERRSDGSVAITVIDVDEAGVGGELGFGGEVRAGGHRLGVKAALRGALIAELGGGRTWVARDDAGADRIVEALGEDGRLRWVTSRLRRVGEALGLSDPPEPAEVFLQGGGRALGAAQLSSVGSDAEVNGRIEAAAGVRWDRRTGERTFYLRDAAAADARLAGELAGGAVAAGGEGRLAYTVDAQGRPRSFSVLGAWSRDGGDGRAQRIETQTTTDLRGDPRTRALARRAMVHPLLAVRIAALRELARGGRLDRRVYATAAGERGYGGSLTLGLKFGGEGTRTTSSAALVDATTRLPDGRTIRREDCLEAAGKRESS